MTWLDRTLAFPTLAVTLNHRVMFDFELLHLVRPLLARWESEKRAVSQITREDTRITLRRAGFTYIISPNEVVVAGTPAARIFEPPGRQQVIEYEEKTPVPFSTYLVDVKSELAALLSCVVASGERRITRVGLVAAVRLESDALPPGVESFVSYILKPFGGLRKGALCNCTVLGDVAQRLGEVDRCIHTVDLNDIDRPGDVSLRLDWQRLFDDPIKLVHSPTFERDMLAMSSSWTDSALGYFGRFGTGDLDYGD